MLFAAKCVKLVVPSDQCRDICDTEFTEVISELTLIREKNLYLYPLMSADSVQNAQQTLHDHHFAADGILSSESIRSLFGKYCLLYLKDGVVVD